MKLLLWVLLGLTVTGAAFYLTVGPWVPRNPAAVMFTSVFFIAPPVGAFWMMYVAIRHERNPLPMILLAFLPYAFLWYYFDRVRAGKHRTRMLTTA